jgi:hypothetical protein
MSNAPFKRKRKNEESYDWVDGELPPPQANWLSQLLSLSWRGIKAPFRWAWQGTLSALRWSWRQTVAMLHWSWRFTKQAAVWTLRATWAATKWTVVAPFRGLRWLFGGEEPIPQNRYDEIRLRIRRHYRRRNRFITHLLLFALANVVMWVNAIIMNYYYYGTMYSVVGQQTIGISIFWGVMLLYHYIRVRMADAEDQAIEAALERERAWEFGQHFVDDAAIDDHRVRLTEEAPWTDWEVPSPEKHKTPRSR